MSKKKNGIVKKYHPNYKKLYPEVEFSEELMVVLNKSDRKIKYMEYDLKHETAKRNKTGAVIGYKPPRECSLERIGENLFSESLSPEELFMEKVELEELHRCLDMLDEDERALITGRYADNLSDEEYARRIGMSQTGWSKRKRRILCKLLKMMN